MGSILWYCFLSHWVLFGILLIYFVRIACFRSLSLGADDFENLQELGIQGFEQQLVGEQSK
jgi:hypothetical protein